MQRVWFDLIFFGSEINANSYLLSLGIMWLGFFGIFLAGIVVKAPTEYAKSVSCVKTHFGELYM